MKKEFFFVVLCVIFLYHQVECGLFSGKKPKVKLGKSYQCSEYKDNPKVMIIELYPKPYNDSHQLLNGNVTITEEWGKQFAIYIELRRKINDQWKVDIKLHKDNACAYLITLFGPAMGDLLRKAEIYKCPLHAGFYEIKDLFFDMYSFPLVYATGEFLLYTKHLKRPKNDVTYCLNTNVEITV